MKTIEHEINKTMSSLDNISQAKAPLGFYDELVKRMEQANALNRWTNYFKAVMAAMIVMSVLNGYLYFNRATEEQAKNEDVASEYFADNTSVIDYY